MDVFGQFLQARQDQAAAAEDRAKRAGIAPGEAPEKMVAELMADIGRRFYQGAQTKRWMQDQKAIMVALTWPAGWLQQRGVSLPVDRYRRILVEIIDGIAEHGDVGKIDYFPAYLQRCVRLWYVHNGEDLYYRQKSIRDSMDLRLLKGGTPAAGPDPIEALAAAHRVLASGRRAAKPRLTDDGQTSFF
jgi:hypothetical protein